MQIIQPIGGTLTGDTTPSGPGSNVYDEVLYTL